MKRAEMLYNDSRNSMHVQVPLLLQFASQFMPDRQMLVLAGGFDDDIEDTAWTITKVK